MLFLPSLTRETWLLAEFGHFLPQLYLIYSIRIRLTTLLLARIDLAIFTFPYQRKRSRRGAALIYRQIRAAPELSIKISANFHNPTYRQCVQNIGNCKLNFLLGRATWFINFWVAIIPGFRLFMPRRFQRWAKRAIQGLAKAATCTALASRVRPVAAPLQFGQQLTNYSHLRLMMQAQNNSSLMLNNFTTSIFYRYVWAISRGGKMMRWGEFMLPPICSKHTFIF